MITREEILKAGWKLCNPDRPNDLLYFVELPVGRDTVQEWFLKVNNGGPDFTIKEKLSGKFATNAEIRYLGDLPDYNALVLLMDWLGIKSSPPKYKMTIPRFDKWEDFFELFEKDFGEGEMEFHVLLKKKFPYGIHIGDKYEQI